MPVDFTEKLLNARQEVQAEKDNKSNQVRQFKEQLLSEPVNAITPQSFENTPTISPEQFQTSADNLSDLSTEFAADDPSLLSPSSPIVSINNFGANLHEDGTFSVVDRDNKVHAGLDELTANRFSGFTQEQIRAEKAGAPTSFLGTKVNAIGQSFVDIGVQAASAFTEDPISLKAIDDIGKGLKVNIPVNRKEQVSASIGFQTVAKNNGTLAAIEYTLTNDLPTLISQGIDSIPWMIAFTAGGPIAQASTLATLAVGKGNQAVQEFIAKNDRNPNDNEVIRIKVASAFNMLAEKYADKLFIDSIPGGLARLSRIGQAVKATTPDGIFTSIIGKPALGLIGEGISGATTSVLDKFAQTGEIVAADIPDIAQESLAELFGAVGGGTGLVAGNIAKNVVTNTLAKLDGSTPEAKTNSFKSPEGTPEGELERVQFRLSILDATPIQVRETPEGREKISRIIDIDEAIKSQGESPALTEERAQLLKDIAVPASQEAADIHIQKLKSDEVKFQEQVRIANLPPAEPIKVEDFEATLAKLKISELSSIPLDDRFKVVSTLIELKKLPLNEAQRKQFEEAEAAFIASVSPTAPANPEILGNIGKSLLTIDDLEKIQRLLKEINADPTPADSEFLSAASEIQAVEKKLSSTLNDRTLEEVHTDVTDGVSSRFTGLNTFKNNIIGILKKQPDKDLAEAAIKVQEDKMNVLVKNLEDKLAKFKEALAIKRNPGEVITVEGKRIGDRDNRTMEYTIGEPMSQKDFEAARAKGRFIWSIGSQSKNLITTLENEVTFGQQTQKLVSSFRDTSLFKKAEGDIQQTALGEEAKNALESTPLGRAANPINLDNFDPTNLQPGVPVTDTQESSQAAAPEVVEESPLEKTAEESSFEKTARELRAEIIDLIEQATTGQQEESSFEKTARELRAEIIDLKAKLDRIEQATTGQQPVAESTTTTTATATVDKATTSTADKATVNPDTEENIIKEAQETSNVPIDSETESTNSSESTRAEGETSTSESTPESTEQSTTDSKQDGNTEGRTDTDQLSEKEDSSTEEAVSDPVVQNYLKSSTTVQNTTITAEQVEKNATKAYDEATAANKKKPKSQRKEVQSEVQSIAERIASNIELAMGFVGKSFKDLIKITSRTTSKGNILPGIETLLDEDFTSKATLEAALTKMKLSEKSANLLATGYFAYHKRYLKVRVDETIETGNLPIRHPLALVYREGELPPQVLFAMMIGANNWIAQHPTNNRFTNDFAKEAFLYGNSQQLSLDEEAELAGIGEGFKDQSSDVGQEIGKLLRYSAINADLSLYYDQLIPALGALALQIESGSKDSGAIFEIITHKWGFDSPVKEGRLFNNGTTYNHIRINNDEGLARIERKDDGLIAIKELTKLIEVGIDTDIFFPAQESTDEVDTNIDGSFGIISKKQENTIKSMQQVEWTAAESLDIVSALNENYRDILDVLMGILPVNDDTHDLVKGSREAKNRDLKFSLDHVLAANAAGKLKKFFFRYKFQVQERIMMQGKINPQGSKVSRRLIRTHLPRKYTKEDIHLFKMAVVQNMGFPVDKKYPEEAIARFDEILADKNVFDAINAIINQDKPGQLAKLADTLLPLKEKFGGDLSLLVGLTALTHYKPEGNFTSDIIFEIDGIANGFANSILQFPSLKSIDGSKDVTKERLAQTGTHIGKEGDDLNHDPKASDVYTTLGQRVIYHMERITPAGMSRSVYNAKNAAINLIFPDFINGSIRDVVKYPFIIENYGGGIDGIANGVSEEIVKSFYERLDAIQQGYNVISDTSANFVPGKPILNQLQEDYQESTIRPFVEALVELGAVNDTEIFITKIIKNETSKVRFNEDTKANITEIIRPRFALGLDDILAGTKLVRRAVVNAGEVLHFIFLAHYNKAAAAKLVSLGRPNGNLTPKEVVALVNADNGKLLKLLPQYRGPLAKQGSNDPGMLDLSKRQIKKKTDKNGNEQNEENFAERIEVKYKKENGVISTRVLSANVEEFTSPGVSALIRPTINLDAAELTLTLAENIRYIPLHDSIMGDIVELGASSKVYGEQYWKLGTENSILDSMYKRILEVRELTDVDTRKEATRLFEEGSFSNKEAVKGGQIPKTIKEVIEKIRLANEKNNRARDRLQRETSKLGGKVNSQQLFIDIRNPKDIPVKLIEETDFEEDEFLASLDRKFISPNKEDSENREFLNSLPNQPRSNITVEKVGDIDSESGRILLKKLGDASKNHYESKEDQAAHTSVLEKVFGSLAKALDSTNVNILIESIDGITQGEFDAFSDEVRISLSRQLPVTANGHSPQEVYTHEVVHAVTHHILKNTPLIKRRVEKLFQQVKADLGSSGGYRVFLADIKGTPSAEDIALAKEQFNYIFDNSINETNRLSEFLAYAVTNKAMINYLSNRISRRPVRDKTLMGKLLEVVDIISEAFEKAVFRIFKIPLAQNPDGFHEMLAVVEHIVAIQTKHQSKLAQLATKGYAHLDKMDQRIRDFTSETATKLRATNPDTFVKQAFNVVTGIPQIILSKNVQAFNARQILHQSLSTTARALASEVGGGDLSQEMIERLLFAKVRISKARLEAERSTIDRFNKMWKSVDPTNPHEMSVETREALTDVIYKADISALRNIGIDSYTISTLIGNPNAIAKLRKHIVRKLPRKGLSEALKFADELGQHIITRETRLHGAHMNALSIAHTVLNDTSNDTVLYLDAYATLAALDTLNTTDARKSALVSQLFAREFAANANENAFIDLLDSHLSYKQKVQRDLFQDDNIHQIKGFVVERTDNLTNAQIGKSSDAAKMKKAGFGHSVPVQKVSNTQTDDTLYVTRTTPEVPFISGMMSTTNQHSAGTKLSDILMRDPAFINPNGTVDYLAVNKEIRRIIKVEEAKAGQQITPGKDLQLRPLVDRTGKIIDFRMIMNSRTSRKLFNPDLEAQNVFAHMESQYVDRKITIVSDKRVVETLVREQIELFPGNESLFVDFLDPNSKYADRARNLPWEVREYMKSFAREGKFMVRRDVIDKVFGYKALDFSQLPFLQSDSMIIPKRYAQLVHSMIREVVAYGKNRIVIALPQVVFGNMMSNVYQLTMRKIPLPYIMYKAFEGYHEYKRYQKDSNEMAAIKHLILTKKLPPTDPEYIRRANTIIQINARLENNRIHRMSEAGLLSLILEGVNTASTNGYINSIHKSLSTTGVGKAFDKIPKSVKDVAATLFMTKGSVPYKFSQQVVLLTDFLARYVMIEHSTEVKKMPFKAALHESINAFVLFDENLTPVAELMDSIGGTAFVAYFLRNQRSAQQLLQASPTSVGLSAATQFFTGVKTLGNLNSAWVTGDIIPNYLQLDGLVGKTTEVSLIEAVKDIADSLFN